MADIDFAPWRLEADEVCKRLEVSAKDGLRVDEIEERQRKYGKNETPEPPKTPLWQLLLGQFEDNLVRILLGAAVISFVLAFFEEGEETITAFVEPFVILTILIANAVVGIWQESNAEAAIKALRSFVSPSAVVRRDGRLLTVNAKEVVPGDICEVHVGDQIPADIRIVGLLSTTIRIDQSLLTGESVTIMKFPDPVLDERERWPTNMLFAGTSVAYGKAFGVVVRTGIHTEYGRLEKQMQEGQEPDTPLKKKLDEFGELLTKVISVICILVWVVNIRHFTDNEHGSFLRGAIYYFKIAVALAVAAIPEGLPAVVKTCLALGTRKMAKKNALIRSLPSVETLGCTTVICSDKTGTLTTNMMSVSKVCFFGADERLQEADVEETRLNIKENTIRLQDKPVPCPIERDRGFLEVARVCALCNDASLEFDSKTNSVAKVGEATEAALRVLVEKIGLPKQQNHTLTLLPAKDRVLHCNKHWENLFDKRATLEFTRDRKSMSAYCAQKADGKPVLFVKGAPENILARSTKVKLSGEKEVPITATHRAILAEKLKELGSGRQTLRCLGLAVRELEHGAPLDLTAPGKFAEIESGLTFVGLVGMSDPPRTEVKDSIAKCYEAGIRVIVITGDNKDTAEAICRRIGVFDDTEDVAGKSFTGYEWDQLSDAAKKEAVKHARLFSRTDPSHKQSLVRALQDNGEVVAMTGDGVNDAPALKSADIGVAMGTGTEVAKAASKMVLSDDNFSTIVSAVEEGRAIYANTKQFIRYLISSNIGEVVCIFLTAMLGLPETLVPVQLLWVNLVTDGLPATALGFNPPDPGIMRCKPRKHTEPIVNGWLFFRYLIIGFYVGLATIGGFVWWYLFYEQGPQISFWQLSHWHTCSAASSEWTGVDCKIFHHNAPPTMSLSVLVTVEMFNAINALSEDESLFRVGPASNKWLLLAIALSFTLHFLVLYTQVMRTIFGLTALSLPEWNAVIAISAPVVIVDEVLKFFSRLLSGQRRKTD